MNRLKLFPSLVASLVLSAAVMHAAEEAKPAAPAAAPAKKPDAFLLVDFRATPNSFAYGSWAQAVAATKDGISIVKGADGKGGCGADCTLSLEDALTEMNTSLPVGWPQGFLMKAGATADPIHITGRDGLRSAPGWMLSALATLFGAPFWFDILQRAVRLKGTGPAPPSDEKKT